jgi:hypothetical protein
LKPRLSYVPTVPSNTSQACRVSPILRLCGDSYITLLTRSGSRCIASTADCCKTFIHLPARRSRLIFDLDSTVVTVFGNQQNAAVGYNPRYRGKKSYDPLLCIEANSSYLWDAELRPGNAGTWDGSKEVLDTTFVNVPPEIREVRVRADAGFGFDPVFAAREARPAQDAVVARLTPAFKRLLPGLSYQPVNRKWEMAEFEHRPHGWPHARRFVVARRFIQQEEAETTLFSMGRYIYRAWVTNCR